MVVPAWERPQLAAAETLWEAARLETRVEPMRAAVGAADFHALAGLAQSHGLSAMLWRALGEAGCRDRLGSEATALEGEATVRSMGGTLLLPHAVRSAVEPLTCAGLEPLVFKGPVLAQRYPDPGLRPMVDIDVILPANQHTAAVEALRASGWRVVSAADRSHYETVLSHPRVPSLALELHRGIDSWFNRSAETDNEELWAARVPAQCFGTAAFALPPEIEFVALVAHAGKPFHTFSRLIWIVDLTVVAAAAPIDWDGVARTARRWKCEAMLAVALTQASRLGLDSPAPLRDFDASPVRRRAIEPTLEASWPLAASDLGSNNRLRYALADRWTRRAVLFAGIPAPAPAWAWPRRYVAELFRATRRAWKLWRGQPIEVRTQKRGSAR